MNPKQRKVLMVAIFLLFVTELFPPWLYEDSQTSRQYSAGYHFILSPEPNLKSEDEMKRMFSITSNERPTSFAVQRDLGRRYGQWLALLFLTIGLLVFLMERKSYVKVFAGGFIVSVGIAFLFLVFHASWFIHA
jgi:hypothetical protein